MTNLADKRIGKVVEARDALRAYNDFILLGAGNLVVLYLSRATSPPSSESNDMQALSRRTILSRSCLPLLSSSVLLGPLAFAR